MTQRKGNKRKVKANPIPPGVLPCLRAQYASSSIGFCSASSRLLCPGGVFTASFNELKIVAVQPRRIFLNNQGRPFRLQVLWPLVLSPATEVLYRQSTLLWQIIACVTPLVRLSRFWCRRRCLVFSPTTEALPLPRYSSLPRIRVSTLLLSA